MQMATEIGRHKIKETHREMKREEDILETKREREREREREEEKEERVVPWSMK
jgi:hypothetical protein